MAKSKKLSQEDLANFATSPSIGSAETSTAFMTPMLQGANKVDFVSLTKAIRKQVADVVKGDMTTPQAMLMAQAMTLEHIFNRYATVAATNLGNADFHQVEGVMRMALKAQAQCSQTLRVLGELKNPRTVAFIQQQNNAAGHQQVNNGMGAPSTTASTPAPANEESPKPSNELLEASDGNFLDAGAPAQAVRGDPGLAPLGGVDRSHDARRESAGGA